MFNTLGNLLSLTTFGESHGVAYGGIINNFPAGLTVDLDKVQYELNRRKQPVGNRYTKKGKRHGKVSFRNL